MYRKQPSISIQSKPEAGIRAEIPAALAGVCLACLLYAAVAWFSCGLLSLEDFGVGMPILLPAGIGAILVFAAAEMILGESYRYGKVIVAAAFIAVFILAAMLLHHKFLFGMNCIADQFSLLRAEATGCIQRRFDRGNDPAGSAAVFCLFGGSAAGALSYLIAYEGRKILTLVVPALILIGLFLRVVKPDAALIMLLSALFVTVMIRFLIDNDSMTRNRGFIPNGILILILFSLATAGAFISTGNQLSIREPLQQKLADKYHNARFEEHRNPLPEGDLTSIGDFKPTGRVSLTVSMSKPESTYLRGFVGERYENGRWIRQEDAFYSENCDLFYWLHKDGFYTQSQRAQLYRMTDKTKTATMTVHNISACRHYIYAPYSLDQNKKIIMDPAGIGDTNISGNAKKRTFQMSYIPGTVYRSYILQKEYASNRDGTEELDTYRDDETAYREIVYRHYLAVPKDVEKTLRDCLGKPEALSTSEAKIRILKYLDSHVTYRTEIKSNKNNELISWFLKKNKAGHSVHYAAASAMMLRYYGIPARYVEGFVIPASQAEEIESDTPVPVTEKNAHAWAEYYLDGVGWIPFETAPDKRDSNMYAAAGDPLTQDQDGDAASNRKNEAGAKDKDKEKKVSDKADFDNPINHFRKIFAYRKAWICGIILFALLILTAMIAVRRIRLRRFVSTFEEGDVRRGLINAFAYSEFIRKRGMGSENNGMVSSFVGEEEYRAAKKANEIAQYSTLEIDETQRRDVIALKDRILIDYRAGRNILQVFIDRFIKCIY